MEDELKLIAFDAITDAGKRCFDVYRCSTKQMSQRPVEFVGRYYANLAEDAVLLARSDHSNHARKLTPEEQAEAQRLIDADLDPGCPDGLGCELCFLQDDE